MIAHTATRQSAVQTQRKQEDRAPSVVHVQQRGDADTAPSIETDDVLTEHGRRRNVVLRPDVWEIPTADAAVLALQRWEGVVLSGSAESFTARIVDAQGAYPDEEVELAYDELSPFDRDLVAQGAIFYWAIGYRQKLPNGSRERVSRIRFRRLPAWTSAEVQEQSERARLAAQELGWK